MRRALKGASGVEGEVRRALLGRERSERLLLEQVERGFEGGASVPSAPPLARDPADRRRSRAHSRSSRHAR